ncbi:MAG TPA: phage virion morphogenesis protein [Saprospiraceae bacterium]|nr:phage virion morphogenesis protein [Saprospiraceae bacterium]HMW74676.1 phage virion morphogenesis protein [Saprospiraceae bacterium]HMX82927.1 phage virion morphogenesis protein [Saprospiraceae bacterium]HMX84523.1 phage virion morphogenesis protein [Saprospiraceae bacterium]HMZ72772.1 phage virion morphogenesis protein [Saprospiraceae bacterium]
MALTPVQFFKRLQASIPKLKHDILNDVIAVEAENFVSENFRKQAYVDKGAKKWPARKDPKNKKALLIGTGTLRNQVTKARVSGDKVVIESSLVYAEVHNEGLKAGRGEGFMMPKRQFIGESATLTKRIGKKAAQLLDSHLNNL